MISLKNPQQLLNMNKSEVLINMGKYPADRNTMSRLRVGLGGGPTTTLYRGHVNRLLTQEAKGLPDVKRIFLYDEIRNKEKVEKWIGDRAVCMDPFSKDAEENLAYAMKKLFDEGATKIVSIATDVFNINDKRLREAFRALDELDVVVGRDQSDGVYLFGTKGWIPEFFQRDADKYSPFDWVMKVSTDLELSRYIMTEDIDIDNLADYDRWRFATRRRG